VEPWRGKQRGEQPSCGKHEENYATRQERVSGTNRYENAEFARLLDEVLSTDDLPRPDAPSPGGLVLDQQKTSFGEPLQADSHRYTGAATLENAPSLSPGPGDARLPEGSHPEAVGPL